MPEITSTTRSAALLRAAFVRRPHGVRGEVRVEALGEDPSRFRPGLHLVREDSGEVLTVRTVRELGDGDVLLSFEEVPSPEKAAGLNGAYLCVPRSDARMLGDDEWFVSDLIGLRAVTPDGNELGTVTEIEAYPAHDVVVIGSGAEATRIPFVKEWVAAVSIEAGTMTVTPWEEA